MPLTVVVGGQYGSEGKGKLVSYLASKARLPVSAVRSGGSNAGHTAIAKGKTFRLRQLPAGVVVEGCNLYLSAGMLIDLPVLLREIEECQVEPERLRIDRNAMLIGPEDRDQETQSELDCRIGSTLTGTGAATARKVLRDRSVVLASSVPALRPYVGDVSEELNRRLDRREQVIVEGTQGFGLSLHHSTHFPFATSRDTSASGFLAEAGLSPRIVDDIYLVLRTYPIRVGGNSGPLEAELAWEVITSRSRYPRSLAEYTTVTGKLRRVGEFDWELARRAVDVNRPTTIAIHGADYLNYGSFGKHAWGDLTDDVRKFVDLVEARLSTPVGFVFTGPEEDQLVDRRPARVGSVPPTNLVRPGVPNGWYQPPKASKPA